MASPLEVMADEAGRTPYEDTPMATPMESPLLLETQSPLHRLNSSLIKPHLASSILDAAASDQPKHVLRRDELQSANPMLTGGKGSSLAVLNGVRGVVVPQFFCISTQGFRETVLANHSTQDALLELQGVSDTNGTGRLPELFEHAARLRESVLRVPLPESLVKAIEAAYDELCADADEADIAVAVRSSATTEDRADASFAGQHDTLLNRRGVKDVMASVKQCWSSLFTDRAVEYRTKHTVPHTEAVMAVVVQVMVEPAVAGTAFNMELSTGFPGVHITASWGLGEAVVSGEVTADEWLVDPSSGRLIKRVRGSKHVEFVSRADRSGVEVLPVSDERRRAWCLTESQVEALRLMIRTIAEAYNQMFDYQNVDTEFAVSPQGDLFMLQCRPVVAMKRSEVLTVDENPKKPIPPDQVIAEGSYSLLGAVSGRAVLVESFEQLGSIEIQDGDILFAPKTANYWNQYLTKRIGIVTMEGCATAHPMLIGRERGMPVICGIPRLMERIRPLANQIVTMCGLTKRV